MRNRILIVTLLGINIFFSAACNRTPPTIVVDPQATFQERVASQELRRYIYLRTGDWLTIVNLRPLTGDVIELSRDERLSVQQFRMKSTSEKGRKVLTISGGSGVSVLYGVYQFVESLGVRFYLHGDVIPDEPIGSVLIPDIDETHQPLFELRGLNPWGSHVEGIDIWNTEDWKRVFTQMTKLKMNFLGVHSYPEHPKPGSQYDSESTVWIGRPEDINDNGKVVASFPSSLYNTMRSQWGHRPKKTGDFAFGASQLFEYDEWGPESMIGNCPMPSSEEACNEVFNRTGAMQRDAFQLANQLGVKTCVGTESPLTIPRMVKGRLIENGKDPFDPEVIKEIYRGIFERIAKTHSLDYYWIWTPEKWLWSLNSKKETDDFIIDINLAIQAWKEVNPPFKLATAGWVLGPVEDRAALDRFLPPGMAVSALSEAYSAPVDPAFRKIENRPKWAIPWLEEDTGILGPQLWVSRVRKDAADALGYGCNGLMGLTWRTRPTGPAIAALARAGWSQKNWNPEADRISPGIPQSMWYEGILPPYGRQHAIAISIEEPVDGAGLNPAYETCRSTLRGYRLQLPDGEYRVTLMFCEPEYTRTGARIFDVVLQEQTVEKNLDIFSRVGSLSACELSFEHISVNEGWLEIVLEPIVSEASISGIVIENEQFVRKINCGGPAFADYEGDMQRTKTFNHGPKGTAHIPRGLACDDFYRDWAAHHFGSETGAGIGRLFARLDGHIPIVSAFDGGAGALWPDTRPWKDVASEFLFIEELEKFLPRVIGTGNRQRLDYWLNTFRHLRTQAEIQCIWSKLNEAMEKKDIDESLLLRKQLNNKMREAYRYLLATVSTPGEMATVLNWEGHIGRRLTDPTDLRLAELLGEPVPKEYLPERQYQGPPRIIVPAIRTLMYHGEKLDLKVIALSQSQPEEIVFFWRSLGSGDIFTKVSAKHVDRGVYQITLSGNEITQDFEYYIEADVGGERIVYPPTAPKQNQTVIVVPQIDIH